MATVNSPSTLLGFPLQVAKFGAITGIDTTNFALPDDVPFLIKNDTATEIYDGVKEGVDVTLDVIPAGSETDEWVTVIFRYDWNPMLVRAVKATATECTLIWGQ